MRFFLIMLMPAFAASTIRIDIVPATETSNASVRYSGSQDWLITEKDQDVFEITESNIIFNLPRLGYDAPSYAHIRRASRFGYRDITVTLQPIKAEIVSHTKRPVIVAVKEFNNKYTVPTIFKGGVKEEVVETLSTTWWKSHDFSVSRSIALKFADQSISYTSSYGKDVHKSTAKTISISSDVEMTLQPGQSAKAILTATRSVLDVKVEYEARVEGDVYCQYAFLWMPYRGFEFDVVRYLHLMDLPDHVRGSEILSIDYYYGAQIDVLDGDKKVPFVLV